MFKTDKEYYADTTHISNSMISAYLKSPAYFESLYITKTIDRPVTPALEFGSAVDCLLTESLDTFNKRFSVKVLKRDNPTLFEENKTSGKTILSPPAWDKVHQVCRLVGETEAYQELMADNTTTQVTLTGAIGDILIKGKLDFLTINGDKAIITDLKTTKNVLPMKFHFHALDYGYYRQMAFYSELVKQTYPEVKDVTCRILAVSKEDWPQIAAFHISQDRVENQYPHIYETLYLINDGVFEERPVSWEVGHEIGGYKE